METTTKQKVKFDSKYLETLPGLAMSVSIHAKRQALIFAITCEETERGVDIDLHTPSPEHGIECIQFAYAIMTAKLKMLGYNVSCPFEIVKSTLLNGEDR